MANLAHMPNVHRLTVLAAAVAVALAVAGCGDGGGVSVATTSGPATTTATTTTTTTTTLPPTTTTSTTTPSTTPPPTTPPPTTPAPTTPPTTPAPTTTVAAPDCSPAAFDAVVRAVMGAQLASITVDRCQNGYARVFGAPLDPTQYEGEQFFVRWESGAWVGVDYGTGLECGDPTNGPELAAACTALGLP